MNTPEFTPTTDPIPLWPRLGPLLRVIGDPVRWGILAELSAGEPLMVMEIAERQRRSADLVSKHLAVLRKAGVVESGRGRLCQIAAPYRPKPGTTDLDFGHCVLCVGREELSWRPLVCRSATGATTTARASLLRSSGPENLTHF